MTITGTASSSVPEDVNANMAAEVRRDSFKNFWDRFSGRPDTNSMMLNHSAEDLEASDRSDILACLPHLADKDVVDIGAGIGRFTTVLAETARWVLSTDFIESFISKNQERNAHLGNVNYQIGDAVHLKMETNSVDLVFTNWLMMYLSDSETIEFIFNCLRWLRPNGYVHLRESCSEPSTGRAKTNTMHTAESNPTHYRFSSLYIQVPPYQTRHELFQLLRNIRFRDQDGKVYKFELQWSCSVPTYIKRQNNWRQVHWLCKKVSAEGEEETTPEQLLTLFNGENGQWQTEQLAWDAKLDNEKYAWTDKIFSKVLSHDVIERNSTAYVFTPRTSSPYLHINAHLLAEKFNCNVWNVETNCQYYRTSLTKANTIKDQRVRFAWNENLASSLDYWVQREASFSSFLATELLSTTSEEERAKLPQIMAPGARVELLEPVENVNEEEIRQKLAVAGIKGISISDVTEGCLAAQAGYIRDHNKNGEEPVASKYLLIQGHF